MGRDPDPTIKEALRQRILDHLLTSGIHDLSLRPLAEAVGTNARMLLYHFGSKEELIIDALELAQRQQVEALTRTPEPRADAGAELAYLWERFSSDDFLPFGKLLLEIEVKAMNGDPTYGAFATETFQEWIDFVRSRFVRCDATTARVIVNTISGSLLDLLVTEDPEHVDAAFEAFSATLVGSGRL